VRKFLWGTTTVGALIGVLTIFTTLTRATGATQEAAGAALACAFSVVPYVIARAFDEFHR